MWGEEPGQALQACAACSLDTTLKVRSQKHNKLGAGGQAVSQQRLGWGMSFQSSHLRTAGGLSTHGSGLDSVYLGFLLYKRCPAETNGKNKNSDTLHILLQSSRSLASLPNQEPFEKDWVFLSLTFTSVFLAHSSVLGEGGSKYPR